jgi:hypothetical protein
VGQSLRGFDLGDDDLRIRTEETLETLLVYGEILEMRTAVDDPWQASPFVLRPAPPSFVIRQDDAVVILGVAGDEITQGCAVLMFPPPRGSRTATQTGQSPAEFHAQT